MLSYYRDTYRPIGVPMPKQPPDDKGKVKFRFVEFELEGLNSTIEESIKTIVQSMNRGSSAPARVITTHKPPAQITSAPESGNGHSDIQPEELEVESEVEDS